MRLILYISTSPSALQCFGAVCFAIRTSKNRPEMTYHVSGGTLNVTHFSLAPLLPKWRGKGRGQGGGKRVLRGSMR